MLKTELRPYQREAVAKARGHHGFAFFPEQRTGKILVSLAVVEERKPDALLIICPKSVVGEWQRQLAQHIEVDWEMSIDIVHYEVLPSRKKQLRRWADKQDHLMVIADESHRIKKRGSAWSRVARSLARRSTDRLILTGTPIAQGLHDAWSQFNFLNPEIFGPWEEFQERYIKLKKIALKDGPTFYKIVGYKNQAEFERIFHEHSYRITLNEARGKATLVQRKITAVQLGPVSRLIYDQLEEELEAEVNETLVEATNILAKALKLQQVCGGAVRDVDDQWELIGSDKLLALTQLLTTINEPVVIVARYLVEIDRIQTLVEQMGKSCTIIKGGSHFTGKFETDVVVIQVQSGVGIDLSAARVLIFYSWDYSYINHDQIRFRIQSYKTMKVIYHYLIVENSIDELLYRVVKKKEKLVDVVCDQYRRKRQ